MLKATWIITLIAGIALVISGVATYALVSTTLAEQNIVTPDDACLPGREVAGPFTAYCQAEIINTHTLEATGGLYYAEIDRDDPVRQTAMTSSFLQASLFTSIVAFGIAAMAFGLGIVLILLGISLRRIVAALDVEPAPASPPPEPVEA